MNQSIDKMNIFEAKSAFSKDSLLHCEHMENYHKMNKFKENEQFLMVLSIGQQNEHILRIFKRQLANVWCDYRENDMF